VRFAIINYEGELLSLNLNNANNIKEKKFSES